MDVKCQQCGVEYEFDDARVTPEGVTVKCTSCGHIFKVKREVRVVTEPVMDRIGDDWMVRQASGNVFTFKELTTLQRWIVERKVTRDDEISRTGRTWKRLGDIAELASFFQVVDDAMGKQQAEALALVQQAASGKSMTAVMAAPAPVTGLPQPAIDLSTPVDAASMVTPAGGAASAAIGGMATQPLQPVPLEADIHRRPTLPQEEQAALTPLVVPQQVPFQQSPLQQAPVAQTAPWEAPDGIDEDDLLDDDDPVRSWRRRRRLPAVLALTVLACALVVGGLALFARPTLDALLTAVIGARAVELSPQLQGSLDEVDRAVQRGVIAELGRAQDRIQRDMAGAAEHPAPIAAIARLAVATGVAEREQVRLSRLRYDALLAKNPDGFEPDTPAMQEATALKQQAEKAGDAAERAFKIAVDTLQDALKLDENNGWVNLAAAEYYRATGLDDLAAKHLDRCAGTLAQDDVRLRVLRALPSGEAVVKDPAALQQLAAQDPTLGQVRYALIRALDASGDTEAARKATEALLKTLPAHQGARAYLAHLQAQSAAETPALVEPPAVKEQAAPPPVAKAPQPLPRKEGKAEEDPGDEEAAGAGFDVLLKRADRLRERGDTARAIRLYNKTAVMEPKRAEPRSGQGWCYLDQGNTAAAFGSFQSALDANPSFAEAHMGMAETFRARGNRTKALLHYQRYLDISPGGPEAAVARRYVKELSGKTD